LALVALGALTIRVLFVLAVRHHHAFGYDATWYHTVANRLADGDGYTVRCPLIPSCVPRATAYFPPGYPLVLALGALVGAHSFLSQQLVSVVLGTGSVVVIGLLGRLPAGPRVGLVAAILAAVYPPLVGADVALMSESLYILVVSAMIVLVYRAIDDARFSRWAAVGLLGGATVLIRSDGLVVLLLLLVFALWWLDASLRRRLAVVGVAGVAASLVVLPWFVRNAVSLDQGVLISNNAAAAVRGANCAPTYAGHLLGSWDIGCLHNGREGTGPRAESQFHRTILHEGVRYALDHPSRLPLVVTVRVLRTWSLYAPRQQASFEENEGRHRPVQLAGSLLVLILLPLAVLGVVILRRRAVPAWPLLAPALAVTITSALTYGNSRFRAAVEPSILVGAATAIIATGDRFVRRAQPDSEGHEPSASIAGDSSPRRPGRP
jgi:4-amino-4-deoxy-L-arabinose transferase-like glycosyltransferase